MQAWFEAVWAEREDKVYAALFGDLGRGVFPASKAIYQRFRQEPVHEGWLHHGVFACPPHAERASWLYVTSGLSNPWNLSRPGRDPQGHSGLGFELVFEAPAPAGFAIPLLHNLMAYELLVAVGRYPGAALFEYGNRIRLDGAIAPGQDSAIRWLLVERPAHYPGSFELPSGQVDFFQLVGATDAEIEFGQQAGWNFLTALLQQHGAHPLTDVARKSVR